MHPLCVGYPRLSGTDFWEVRTFPIRPRNHVHKQSSVLTVRRIHPRTRPTGENRRLTVGKPGSQIKYVVRGSLCAVGVRLLREIVGG